MSRVRILPPQYADSWEIYAALLFLGLFLWPLRNADTGVVLLSLACLAAFLPLYFLAHWLKPLPAAGCIAGIALLGAVVMAGNPGASVFFTYAACLCCLTQRPAHGVPAAGAIIGAFVALAVLAERGPAYILIDVFVTVAVCVIYLQVRRGNLIREGLSRRDEEVVELARIAERERIAVDLHDLFGQTFALLAVKAELAARLLADDPRRARRELDGLADLARDGLGRARETLHGWTGGLDEEIATARELLEAAGVKAQVEIADAPVTPMADGLMALILRESVTNVVRHSQARTCVIRLSQDPQATILVVADDGRGSATYEGQGVRGMRDRAKRLGGRVQIARRGGTEVRLVLPRQADA